jgi:uncharacterized protein YhhL (DUF1145 family)
MKIALINLGKLLTVVIWAYGIATYFTSLPYGEWARWLIAIIAISHAAEALILAPKLQAIDGRSRTYHVWNIFVFGLFHTLSVKAKAAVPAS